MPFKNLTDIKTSITGTTIEDYTDTLAISFNAQNVRSSSDTAYIQQQTLYGLEYAVKYDPDAVADSLIDGSSIGIEDTINKATGDKTDLIGLDNLASNGSIGALDNADLSKVFRVLMLNKYTCTGRIFDGDMQAILDLYIKSQVFWQRYRLIKGNLSNFSQDFVSQNRNFVAATGEFGSDSGLTAPGSFKLPGTPTCLFSEGGNLSLNYKILPVSNDLDKLLFVSFNYTCCEIVEG